MYNYVGDLCSIYHFIINNYIENKKVAIDATLGNGHDTDFLSKNFNRVYAFDIQKNTIDNYKEKNKDNVILINDSHSKFRNYINEEVQCIVYNLGFLPGGDKSITTSASTSLESIKTGLELLSPGAYMFIACYVGHDEGKREYSCINEYLNNLPTKKYGVMEQSFINRHNNPPKLFIIEKNN